MRLSPGFGTVRLIDRNRRNPYAVHPPTMDGKRPKAICYVEDRETGIAVLKLYHEGKYKPGMCEELIAKEGEISSTFQEVYDLYWDHRFGECAVKELDKSSQAGTRSAWKRLERFRGRRMDEVTIMELQGVVNETAKEFSKTTVTRVIGLIKGMYKFALPRELCRKNVGAYIETPKTKEEEHHDSFTDEEIDVLWRAASSDSDAGVTDGDCAVAETGSVDIPSTASMILTMIYSGFRIGAWGSKDGYDGMKADLENMTFTGGVKTEAGKNRVVPIHSGIVKLVQGMQRTTADGNQITYLCGKGQSQFRRDMKTALEKIGVRPLTPHSCRHTFHRLLEKAGVNEADRKRLMGHSLKGDITNGTYGHRGIEELRAEVEKIEVVTISTGDNAA